MSVRRRIRLISALAALGLCVALPLESALCRGRPPGRPRPPGGPPPGAGGETAEGGTTKPPQSGDTSGEGRAAGAATSGGADDISSGKRPGQDDKDRDDVESTDFLGAVLDDLVERAGRDALDAVLHAGRRRALRTGGDDLLRERAEIALRDAAGSPALVRRLRMEAARSDADADAHYVHGLVADADDAEKALRRALEADPGHVPAMLALGETLLTAGDLDEAARLFGSARDAVEPSAREHGLALVGLAETERRAGDLGAAEASLRRALSSDPQLDVARIDLGVVLVAQGALDAARTVIDPLVADAPHSPSAVAAKVLLEMAARDAEPPVDEEVVEADAAGAPDRDAADDGDELDVEADPTGPESAVAALDTALRALPGALRLRVARAWLADALGGAPAAEAVLRVALEAEDPPADALVLAGALRLRRGDADGAYDLARDALDVGGDDHLAALVLRGLARGAGGSSRKAVRDLDSASDAAPDDALPRRALGAHEASRGRWRDALRAFDAALEVAPDEPRSLIDIARVQRAAGDAKDAAETLETAVATHPESADAWLLLARVCHEDLRKSRPRAAQAYRRYVALGGDDRRVNGWLEEVTAK